MLRAGLAMKRSELYATIWAEPVVALATRVGCSDTWIKKICRKHGVPMPPRGHWMRVHAGHDAKRIPLPAAPDVDVGLNPRQETETAKPALSKETPASKTGVQANVPHAKEWYEAEALKAATEFSTATASTEGRPSLRAREFQQFYRDAEDWQQFRLVNDFLNCIVSHVADREPRTRDAVLRFVDRMRAQLREADPLRGCVERIAGSRQ